MASSPLARAKSEVVTRLKVRSCLINGEAAGG